MWQHIKQQLTLHPETAEKTRNALSASWNNYIERLSTLPRGSLTLTEALQHCSWIGAPVSVQAARDPRLVGLRGVGVWDSEAYVHVLVQARPVVVSVPRAAAVIGVDLPQDLAEAYGHPRIQHVGDMCSWVPM